MSISNSLALASNEVMYLATSGSAGAQSFLDSEIGGTAKVFLGAIGVVVIFVGLVKGFGAVASGKVGQLVKIIFATGILAALLFNPNLALNIANTLGTLLDSLISSASDLA